jgi:hypothetical protein
MRCGAPPSSRRTAAERSTIRASESEETGGRFVEVR